MKNSLWNKRIPTILSLVLIIVGIVVTSALVKSGVIIISKAGPSQIPQNTRITNITDTSFTVTYETEDSVIGSVNFGKDVNLGQNGLDQRDQTSNSVASHQVHSITITNLKPETKYYFSIMSGANTFLNNDNPFEVKTGQIIETAPFSQMPITGNVLLPNGAKPNEAIIYITADGAQTISALLKPDGSYLIPLNSLKTNDLSSYYKFENNSVIRMLVSSNSLKSNVLLSKDQVNIPTITLSKDYDFTVKGEPVVSESASSSAQSLGFPAIPVSSQSAKSQTPQILTPKKDEGFSDQQPLFKGKGQPNQSIKVIIHSSENIQTTVSTDSLGNWNYRPTQPLSPGDHTITIETKDASGIIKTITQSFVVYASGTQVAQSATPSGSLTPTINPTPTSTPIPTPTPIPTAIVTQPIPTPTPTIFIQTQTKGGLPPTGPSDIIITGIIGLGIILTGGLLFLKTSGKIRSV